MTTESDSTQTIRSECRKQITTIAQNHTRGVALDLWQRHSHRHGPSVHIRACGTHICLLGPLSHLALGSSSTLAMKRTVFGHQPAQPSGRCFCLPTSGNLDLFFSQQEMIKAVSALGKLSLHTHMAFSISDAVSSDSTPCGRRWHCSDKGQASPVGS